MRLLVLCFLALSTLAISSCKTTGTRTAQTDAPEKPTNKSLVKFIPAETLSDVLEKAEAQNKLVFVDFYADWCLPCKMMDEDVFTDKTVASFYNENFLNYKVNAEEKTGPNLVFVYGVQVYPTLLFLDAKGNVIEKKEGAAYQTEMLDLGRKVLASQGM
ncbi:MAG: thioredoxin family protein [Bacteroidota bacterium]